MTDQRVSLSIGELYNQIVSNVAALERIAITTRDTDVTAADLASLRKALEPIAEAVTRHAVALNEHIMQQAQARWSGSDQRHGERRSGTDRRWRP